MSEVEGVVSLWLGSAATRAAFDGALLAAFSPDGDFLGSPFSRGFGIGYYGDALREAEYLEPGPRTLSSVLAGGSYSEVTIPAFQRLSVEPSPEDNCVVLLYDYRHDGHATQWSGAGVSLRFVGTVPYRRSEGEALVTELDVKQAILALVLKEGPIGWYRMERRLRIPRSAFKDGYTLMTYLEELIAAGSIVRIAVDGEERFVESAADVLESRDGESGLDGPRSGTVEGKASLGAEITPHVGAFGVAFGMSGAEVASVLGPPSREFFRGPLSTTPEWQYLGRGIIVSFDALGTCDALQLDTPCSPLLRGLPLLSMSATSAMAALRRLDPEAVLHDDTLVSLHLGVALFAPELDNHPDWPASGMIAFRPDYYGSPGGEVG